MCADFDRCLCRFVYINAVFFLLLHAVNTCGLIISQFTTCLACQTCLLAAACIACGVVKQYVVYSRNCRRNQKQNFFIQHLIVEQCSKIPNSLCKISLFKALNTETRVQINVDQANKNFFQKNVNYFLTNFILFNRNISKHFDRKLVEKVFGVLRY